MESLSNETQEPTNFCKKQYKNNPTQLEIIEEFERDYSSNRALWWYTRQSFLYPLLNKALRKQDIDLLYLFRFFIRDLGQQLENNKCLSPIRVYRAQHMSKEEIKILNNCVGDFISMNTFLSTSLNRKKARSFLAAPSSNNGVEKVFFEVDADPGLENIKPFSNVVSLSYYPKEKEVLFMIGSIFQLVQMECDNDGIWNIQMVLCSDNNHQLQSLFQHMKNKSGTGATNLLQFGHVLRRMGNWNDAEKYYHLYLNQLSDHHSNTSLCYHALGMVADEKGDYDLSLNWYNKTLEIDMRTLTSDHPNIANIHNSIGEVHRKKGNDVYALESYKKALISWTKVYGEDAVHIAVCLNNMGNVYQNRKKYSMALECHEKALVLRRKHLPDDHFLLGASQYNIGTVYRCLSQYDEALDHYNLSLTIYMKSLPSQHPSIARTLESIGHVYEKKGDFQQALTYYGNAAKIYRRSFSPTHHNVIKIDDCITRVLSQLNSF